jgi:hypothetical protein
MYVFIKYLRKLWQSFGLYVRNSRAQSYDQELTYNATSSLVRSENKNMLF